MSSCTHACLDVYKDAVDNTCDAVDSGIKVCTSFFIESTTTSWVHVEACCCVTVGCTLQ